MNVSPPNISKNKEPLLPFRWIRERAEEVALVYSRTLDYKLTTLWVKNATQFSTYHKLLSAQARLRKKCSQRDLFITSKIDRNCFTKDITEVKGNQQLTDYTTITLEMYFRLIISLKD